MDSVLQISKSEGLFACPEGAATLAATKKLIAEGEIEKNETVVLFNTGSGLKYTDLFDVKASVVNPKKPFNYGLL
jgi:threonine synthase